MKKMKKRSNGFTLTELAIVIAVIAILIAVLVPTFTSLINKAQESSDSQLVKNLNTALSVDEATNDKANTMSEALAVAAENGYNVDKLTPASSGDIVWDQESNRFLLINEDGEIVYSDSTTSSDVLSTKYQLWYIAQDESDVDKGTYSYYIAYEATEVEATYGVDVGDNSGVAVTIKGDSSVNATIIVNTNGGTLTVDAESYDVSSYGTTHSVVITAVSKNSFHVYSEVTGTITLVKGHLDIKESSTVSSVYIATETSSDVEVTNSSSNQIEISADKNEVAIEVASSVSNATALQVTDTVKGYFNGGLGTEANPFQINNNTQLANIGYLSSDMEGGKTYYFQLTNDIVWNHIKGSYITNYLNGVFDGNGYSITISATTGDDGSGYGTHWFFTYPVNTTVKNLTIYETSFNLAMTYGWSTKQDTLTFDNVTIGDNTCTSTELQTYKNTSAFIEYFYGKELTFNNCVNYYSYRCDTDGDYTAIFLGGFAWYTTITFNSCINYGNITADYAAVFIGNVTNFSKYTLSVTNCINTGAVYYFTGGNIICANASSFDDNITATFNDNCTGYDKVSSLSDANLALSYNGTTNVLSLTKSTKENASKYLLTYSCYANYSTSDGLKGTSKITLSFDITTSIDSKLIYGIVFYDKDTYMTKYSKSKDDVKALMEITSISSYYSCSFGGVTVYFDTSTDNGIFVVDYSGLENSDTKTYTISGTTATVQVALYNGSGSLLAVSTAKKVST